MIKINLEKELIKQNKSLVSAKELLFIKEHDRLGKLSSDKTLSRVFGETSAYKGEKIKARMGALQNETRQFDQSRVFHISQIEKLCKKYHLRFLESCLFKGSIDKELPKKIAQFEIANGVECGNWSQVNTWREQEEWEGGNTYIAAPASSFQLQERPKDPLLFYKINDEFYYLIHKWGNDLSIVRRLYPALSNTFVSWLIFIIPCAAILTAIVRMEKNWDDPHWYTIPGLVVFGVAAFLFTIVQLMDGIGWVEKNDWRSRFSD